MRWTVTLREGHKRWIADAVVGTILFGAIVLTGCDTPKSWRSNPTDESGEATAVVAARIRTESPTVTTPPTPISPRVVTYDEAEAAFRGRRYTEAVQLFSTYVETKPENPWGHYMLGLSAWKSLNHARAEEAFERALALDPTHGKSYLNLARVLLETGRPAEALTRVDSALALDSLSHVAYRLRGRALGALDRIDEAVDAYRHAITLNDRDAWSMNNLGLLYLTEGWPEEALYPLARAVALDSGVTTFLNNLGMALEHTGRFTLAAETYRRAVAADSTHVKAAANLARVEGRTDDPLAVPVDLAVLAQEFASWIDGWQQPDVTVARQEDSPQP